MECPAPPFTRRAAGPEQHDLLVAEGTGSTPVRIAAETRENVTVTEAASGDQYRFVLPGPQLRPEEWQACLAQLRAIPEGSILVASGSLPPGLPATFYREAARTAADQNVLVVLGSSGDALAAAIEAGVFMVKPNLRELSELFGRKLEGQAEWLAAGASLVDAGAAEVVALSLGASGVMLVSRGLRLYAPAVFGHARQRRGRGEWLCRRHGLAAHGRRGSALVLRLRCRRHYDHQCDPPAPGHPVYRIEPATPTMIDDTTLPFWFRTVRGKKLVAGFDGGRLSSYGGVMLLSEAARRMGIAERLAAVTTVTDTASK